MNSSNINYDSSNSTNSINYKKEEINGIFIDISGKNVLCISKDNGYRILSIPNFEKITENNELGELKIVYPFYLSEILLLVGKNEFSKIRNNQLIIYNDKDKSILGKINFELEIYSIKTIFNYIIINFKEQTIIYDILTLIKIKTINNTLVNLYSTIINIRQNKFCIISIVNQTQISIISLILEDKNKTLNIIDDKNEELINVNCSIINNISCDNQSMNILIQLNEDNKFNIYNAVSKELIYSFEMKENLLKIKKILFRDNIIICLFSNFLIHVYKIKILNKREKLDFFHKYKYDYKYYDEIIDKDYERNSENRYIINFSNDKLKNDFIIYDYHGNYQKIKFSSNNSNNIYCYLDKKFNI